VMSFQPREESSPGDARTVVVVRDTHGCPIRHSLSDREDVVVDVERNAEVREPFNVGRCLGCHRPALNETRPLGPEPRAAMSRLSKSERPGRAVVKRHGGIMPPELRTPLESFELVDELRQRLAEVADLARQLSSNELEDFSVSLKADTNERLSICSGESMMVGLEQCVDLALALLDLLGVHQNAESGEYVYLPFVMRTAAVR